MMKKLFQNLSSHWNMLPKDIPVLTVQKGTGLHYMISIDSTQLAFHTTAYSHDMPVKQAIALDGYTLDELVQTINSMGYVATLDPTASSKGFGSRQASVLMETTNSMIVAPYTINGFTSNLWQMLYPLARLLEENDNDMDEAVNQMYAGLTGDKFMDYWATFFKVKRNAGETDMQLQKRMLMAITNMKTNTIAIQQLVQMTVGGNVQIKDTMPAQFEVLVDPAYIGTRSYIYSIVNDVKTAGVEFILNHISITSEDYKNSYKLNKAIDFQSSDIFTKTATNTFQEGRYGYTTNSSLTVGVDQIGTSGAMIMTQPTYKMSDTCTMTFTLNGTVTRTATI